MRFEKLEGRRRGRPLCALLALSAIIAWSMCPRVSIGDEAEDLGVVVMFVTPSGAIRSQPLRQALEAHLSGTGIDVTSDEIEHLPDDDAAAGSRAEEAAGGRSVVSIVWLTDDGEEFFILTPSLSPKAQRRSVPHPDESWPVRCDAVAIVLHSDVEALLSSGDKPPGEVQPDTLDPDPGASSNATGTGPEANSEVTPESEPPLLGFSALLGYAPTAITPGGPFVHGAALGLGLSITRYFEIGAGVDLIGRSAMSVEGGRAELAQWPVHLSAAVFLPIGKIDMGVRVGWLGNIWKVRGLDDDMNQGLADPNITQGASLGAVVRYHLLDWLAAYAGADFDFLFGRDKFYSEGEQVLLQGPVRIRLGAGAAVAWKAGKK